MIENMAIPFLKIHPDGYVNVKDSLRSCFIKTG